MAENNLDINIRTKADTSEVKDLKTALEELKDSEIEIKTNIDNDDLKETEDDISKLDNESIGVEVDADDSDLMSITAEIEDIEGTSLSIDFELDSEGNIESTKAELDDINGELLSVELDIDSTSIDDASNKIQDLNDSLDDATTSAFNFSDALNSIDSSNLDNLNNSTKEVSDNMKDASSSTTSLVDAMAAGEISSGLADTLMNSVNAAGSYSDTMVRLGYAMTSTSMTAEQAQSKFGGLISTMASETGRGAGAVRNHLISMGNVGITNSEILQKSFEGISKASFQTGNDIGALDKKFQMMVLSGMANKRNLTAFGLSVQDLAKAMGVSVDEVSNKFKELDENSRASVLSTALNMKYGADVTENYKNSYEHLTEEVSRAKDFLIRSVGEALLPSVIPVMKTTANVINGVTSAFRNLPAPVQSAIGIFGAFVIGLSSVSLGLSAVMKVASFAISPFRQLYSYFFKIPDGQQLTKFRQHLNSVGDMANTVKTKIMSLGTQIKNLGTTALQTARKLATSLWNGLKTVASMAKTAAVELAKFTVNLIKSGVEAVITAGKWLIAKGVLIAQRTATMLAAGAQAFLNLVMSMNPIILVITAIIALIAILGYLYFTNEDVRNAIDGLGQALVGVWNWIVSSVGNAVNSIIAFAQGLYTGLMGVWTWITDGVNNTVGTVTSVITGGFTWIQDAFNGVIAFFQTYGLLFVEIFFVMATGGIGAIFLLIGQMNGMPSTIGAILQSALTYVTTFASNFINRLVSAGTNAVNRFKSSISRLPGALRDELNEMINEASNFIGRIGQILYNAGVNAVKNFLNGLGRHSPGIIQTEMLAELKETATRIPESSHIMKRNIFNLAKDVVDSWGNPQFEYGFADNDFKLSNYSVSNNSNLTMLLNTIIALLQNLNGGNFVFNHYGDIDNEEKMERILEAIRRELSWNNQTAGRTV